MIAKKVIKFKEGEVVLVLRKAKSFENGWKNNWEKDMDLSVGGKYRVLSDNGERGVQLEDGNFDFEYPRHVLKRVKPISKRGRNKK